MTIISNSSKPTQRAQQSMKSTFWNVTSYATVTVQATKYDRRSLLGNISTISSSCGECRPHRTNSRCCYKRPIDFDVTVQLASQTCGDGGNSDGWAHCELHTDQ